LLQDERMRGKNCEVERAVEKEIFMGSAVNKKGCSEEWDGEIVATCL